MTDIDGSAPAHRQTLTDAETLVGRLDEDEDDLLAELGRELLGEGLGFGSEDFDRARRFAACRGMPAGSRASELAAPRMARSGTSFRRRGPKGWAPMTRVIFSAG